MIVVSCTLAATHSLKALSSVFQVEPGAYLKPPFILSLSIHYTLIPLFDFDALFCVASRRISILFAYLLSACRSESSGW